MTTEEKARAYDEALERARKQRDDYQKELNKADKNSQLAGLLRAGITAIDMAFPELAESEDERIRKRLVEYFNGYYDRFSSRNNVNVHWEGLEVKAIIAYLERQKDLAAIPDELVKNYKLFYEHGGRELALLINAINGFNKQKEQKPSDPDVKGRRGRIGNTPEHIRKKAENFLSKMEPPYDADDICSAYEKGAMESIKLEWSEEDERMLRTIISDGSRGVELDSKQISWLKSLRRFWNPSAQELGALKTAVSVLTEERTFPKAAEQIQKIIDVFDGKELRKDWKPSEEQMKALEDAFRKDGSDEYRKTINSLYQQLKKL